MDEAVRIAPVIRWVAILVVTCPYHCALAPLLAQATEVAKPAPPTPRQATSAAADSLQIALRFTVLNVDVNQLKAAGYFSKRQAGESQLDLLNRSLCNCSESQLQQLIAEYEKAKVLSVIASPVLVGPLEGQMQIEEKSASIKVTSWVDLEQRLKLDSAIQFTHEVGAGYKPAAMSITSNCAPTFGRSILLGNYTGKVLKIEEVEGRKRASTPVKSMIVLVIADIQDMPSRPQKDELPTRSRAPLNQR